MTIGIKTKVVTEQTDGEVEYDFDSFTVAEGELYYLESITCKFVNVDSNPDFAKFNISVRDEVGDKSERIGCRTDDTSVESSGGTKQVGRYLYPGMSVVMEERRDDAATDTEVLLRFRARQVL